MTSVLPPWKLELIERKKKKEQEERQKLEDERSRKVSIPEWKKSLLDKKKEGPSDSPETKEQASSVNSVFGPRILRKTSEKTIAIANASQRPVTKVEEDNISKRKVSGENATRSHGSLYSKPADSNSCVTKAVEIPTEVVHKTNKNGFLQREVENYRESTHRSDGTLSKENSKVSVTSNVQSAGVQWAKTKVDNEAVKAPSVLSFRRMFEQSKPADNMEIAKSSESIKADTRSDKRTTESKLVAANDDSQLHVLDKSTGDNAQSIHMEKSTSLHASETDQRNKTTIASPPPTIASKPYKNFVSTPPWLKNTTAKNVTFSAGKKSVQETTVANVNTDVEDVSKDSLKPGNQKSVVTVESDVKEKAKKTLNDSNQVKPGTASEPGREKPVDPDTKKINSQLIPQDQTVQKYSIVTQPEVEEQQKAGKPVKQSGNQKYVVITNRKQQEPTHPSEKAVTVISTDHVSQVSNELVPHKDNQEGNEDDFAHHSSIESVRSMFGPSVGFRKRTSSEENLFVSESIEHGSVLRRPGQSKRTKPATVRWSADVLSLMSEPIDDDNDDDDSDISTLSPRSDSKIPSSDSSQAKRPPPPVKRWTADVLSVVSQSVDSDSSNLSPRSDSSVTFSPSNSLTRARSSSLSDIREEQGLDYFQHKPNVSQGIEHRMHKLIRRVSVSETSLHAEEGDSDSVSDDSSAGYNDMDFNSKEAPNAQATLKGEITDHALIDTKVSQPTSFPVEQDIEPVFARKRSISHDIEHRVSELFHRQLSQQSDGGESEGEKTWESDDKISTDQVVEKVPQSAPEKLETEPVTMVTNEKLTDFVAPSTEIKPKEDSDHVVRESKPSKGSVHKLSALFGSSIWKPNKKDKGSSEEKTKVKESVEGKPQKIPLTENSNIKELAAKKEESKKSSLFSKSHKTEEKSMEKKEKEPSNGSFFPWLKKRDKEEEKPGQNKTTNVEGKNKKNSSSSSTDELADTLSIATHGLQPVRKTEKVEQKQRLVGKVMIISNASHEQAPPKGVYHKPKPSFQLPEQQKEKTSTEKSNNYSKPADFKRKEFQIPTVVTQHWNGNQKSPVSETRTNESVPITSIDEVPVSSIDMPESEDNDVTVSVIDVPASPDVRSDGKFVFLNGSTEEAPHPSDDVSVSVIDLPSPVAKEDAPHIIQDGHLEADELSDGSDSDEVEGSYDFATGEISHQVNGDISPEDDEDDSDEDDDDDDDDDDDEEDEDEDVPVSYIGAAPRYPVPQVVFDSEPVQLKSCLSPKLGRRKVKRGNVSFKSSHVIHDYPSEEIAKVVFDELQNNNNVPLKTLQNYQPSGLVDMEKKLGRTGGNSQVQVTQSVSNDEKRVHDMSNGDSHPEIKYADDGQGFTDATDSASALLF